MAVSDIYQITLNGTFLGQDINNVFFYEQVDPADPEAGIAEGLALEWRDTVFLGSGFLVGGNISTGMVYNRIRVINLFNDADFYELNFPSGTAGTNAGEVLPPYAAYSFRSRWLGTGVRRAMKRFAGMPEGAQIDGFIVPAILEAAETLELALEAILTVNDASLVPVQVKRIRIPVIGTEPQQYVYRLPETVGEAETVYADGWKLNPVVGTQNSRKIGRGS